ncbi:MAG TPA: hypothetical protein VLT58_00865 [Polyangia bacterium]|nr:hypothetical protein [Polyangia bacterium]
MNRIHSATSTKLLVANSSCRRRMRVEEDRHLEQVHQVPVDDRDVPRHGGGFAKRERVG